jgi:hypothetical protein
MLSTVLILPEEYTNTGNAAAAAMGWGPENYSVPLSADGSEPATHYGLHAWVGEAFQQMVETNYYPPELEQAGISQADYDAMTAVLISSFWDDYVDHFATICAENDLQVMEETDEGQQRYGRYESQQDAGGEDHSP